jgi:hypothetical protein
LRKDYHIMRKSIIYQLMVVYSKLLEKFNDSLGYITYVFELLDNEDKLREKTKYLMCTQPPNWECENIDYNEVGYLEVKPVIAGVDEWYDGEIQQKYRYSNIWFSKFVPVRPKNIDTMIIK